MVCFGVNQELTSFHGLLADKPRGQVGRTREEFVNHEPQASDLRILVVLVVYCFYIITQKTLEISMDLPAQ